MQFLTDHVEIREVGAPVAAASDTDDNSDRIDMTGFEGVVFVCPITDSVATGVATLTIEQNTLDSDTGMAALSGATATDTCAVNDDLNNQLLVIDIKCPQERYIQAVRTSGTANIAFGTLTAILYNPRTMPVSEDDTVLDLTQVTGPAEA